MTSNINASIKRCIKKYRATGNRGYIGAVKTLWHKRRLLQAGKKALVVDVTALAVGIFGGAIPLMYAFDTVNGIKKPQVYFDKKVEGLQKLEAHIQKSMKEIKGAV